MLKNSKNGVLLVLVFVLVVLSAGSVCFGSDEQLRSSQVGELFFNYGRDLYTAKNAGIAESQQAMLMFTAAAELDNNADYLWGEIINLAWSWPSEDYSEIVYTALLKYVNKFADLEVAMRGVSYLLERLDSREQRQELLGKLVAVFGEKNHKMASDLWMRLGFLTAEVGDNQQAQGQLMNAYSLDKYNMLAFAKLSEISAGTDEGLSDYMYLQNLRNAVTVNPLDFRSAYAFGQYCDSLGLFEPAVAAYKYCVSLGRYLGPDIVDVGLYRLWVLSSYNAGKFSDCFDILETVRNEFGFDLVVEATCSAVAMANGDQEKLAELLGRMEVRSKKLLDGQIEGTLKDYEDYAWFYAFLADTNSQDMLTWATMAYNEDNTSANAGALFGYALAVNGQVDLAKSVIKNITQKSQISTFAMARIEDADGNTPGAVELLKLAISAGAGTFEAQKAKVFLQDMGEEYAYFIDPAVLVTALKSNFGSKFFNDFIPPEKMVSVKFSTRGSVFSHGSDIKAELAIINNSSEPMIVSSDSVFKGNIRIDAKISGDIEEEIPELIVRTVMPSTNIQPGEALFVPLELSVGRLKKITNNCYPQANLQIAFTIYLDPVVSPDGDVKSFFGIGPEVIVVKRPKLNLNTRYLQQRFDALKRGHQGQKIKSSQLFASLICEQQMMKKSGRALYKYQQAEPQLLSSAIVRCINEDDWVLKCYSIMVATTFEPDYRLIESISDNMDDENWAVRFTAVLVLGGSSDEKYHKMLQWTAKNDSNELVRNMATLILQEK